MNAKQRAAAAALEDPILDIEICIGLLKCLFERESNPPQGTIYLLDRLDVHAADLREKLDGALPGGAQ